MRSTAFAVEQKAMRLAQTECHHLIELVAVLAPEDFTPPYRLHRLGRRRNGNHTDARQPDMEPYRA